MTVPDERRRRVGILTVPRGLRQTTDPLSKENKLHQQQQVVSQMKIDGSLLKEELLEEPSTASFSQSRNQMELARPFGCLC
mmetsp:Transcript_43845/g.138467  ORF Transcript_43845/g.138467 Transcript_43845/m.138467 type:complete len:81 (+) Transcript_43845:129-371(+)